MHQHLLTAIPLVHVVRTLNELGNSDWKLAMKAKRRKENPHAEGGGKKQQL